MAPSQLKALFLGHLCLLRQPPPFLYGMISAVLLRASFPSSFSFWDYSKIHASYQWVSSWTSRAWFQARISQVTQDLPF